MLETLVDCNDCNNVTFTNEKLQQAVSKVTTEMKEKERDAKRNNNNVTMDTLFHQSPVTINTKGEIANVTNKG